MKLWSGRFRKETDALVNDFNSSIPFDQRLYREDIEGSMAHASMLGEQGIISIKDMCHRIFLMLHQLNFRIHSDKLDKIGRASCRERV